MRSATWSHLLAWAGPLALFVTLFCAVSPLLADVSAPASTAPEVAQVDPMPAAPADPAAPAPAPAVSPAISDETPSIPAGTTTQGPARAGSEGAPELASSTAGMWLIVIWALALLASIGALVQAYLFYQWMIQQPEGTEEQQQIAEYVREGAGAYLWQQYKVVAIFFVVIVILLALAAFGLGVQSKFVPFAFLTGGFFSGLAGYIGMTTATRASNRTAAAAESSLNEGLQVAFRSGAVMGLTVVGLGLLDICLWFGFLYWVWPMLGQAPLDLTTITVTMLCFGMGASSQALFARVGGGIFTKAADVGADLVGKVEAGIPEDDPRNPAVIADNVGDNVGDVAGMGADLYESYCGSILASAALGVAAYAGGVVDTGGISHADAQFYTLFLPIALAAAGIVLSIAGAYLVRTGEDTSQKNLLAALAGGIDFATWTMCIAAIAISMWLMPKTAGTVLTLGGIAIPGLCLSIIVGIVAGWAIGKVTEYYTAAEYAPTQELAEQARTGPATVIIGGIAEGMLSTWAPVLIVCGATLVAFGAANGWRFDDINYFALGLYGVGIAAVGMLSTLGITLATDAYGPIADNAGGNAEMSHRPKQVRERTDALDSLGNTTAATGKGFAIGSAALTALALLAAYVEEVRQGFQHWGDSVAETALHTAEPGFYKVSHSFVVEIPATKGEKSRKYLVMPTAIREPEVQKDWDAIPITKEPARIPETLITLRRLPNGQSDVRFAKTQGKWSQVRFATLPEFAMYYDASLMNPKVVVGLLIGAMATFLFCALTMKAVGRAAKGMVEEVRRQFRENPGIMLGTSKPDYTTPVAISTQAAQYEMIVPSALALVIPVVIGLLLGVGGVLGLLMGTLSSGFCVAVFMANSGGAWDNAKKYIEAGHLEGHKKGSDPHKAAVVGDTVGDPFKDTSGPSLNILIKLMSMVSVVAAGLVVRYSLAALGIF